MTSLSGPSDQGLGFQTDLKAIPPRMANHMENKLENQKNNEFM